MRTIKKIMIATLLLNTALLSACGGGGGAPAAVAPTARAITTNTLRTFANGDNIQYTVTGTSNIGAGTVNGTGTLSSTYTMVPPVPVNPAGIPTSVNTIAINVSFTDGSLMQQNIIDFYNQDAAGNFNYFGDQASGFITNPISGFVLNKRSPIVSPDSWVNSYTQQNGDTTTETITILGKATVNTGMGSFETYKIQIDATLTLLTGETTVSNIIDYIVPSIGLVKSTFKQTTTNALGVAISTTNLTAVASTTNIAF